MKVRFLEKVVEKWPRNLYYHAHLTLLKLNKTQTEMKSQFRICVHFAERPVANRKWM